MTRTPRSRRRVLLEYGLTLLAAIALAYAAEALAVKPFAIPTASMATTVRPGDRVLIDRASYHFEAIHRGDIIVFGGHGPIPLLKRVVGLPGDRLSLSNGRLLVNGGLPPTPGCGAWAVGSSRRCRAERLDALEPCPALHGARRAVLRDGRQPHGQRRQPLLGHGDARQIVGRAFSSTGRRNT